MVVCLSIWGECSVTCCCCCCCCCSGLYGFCSVLFLCGKLIFKKQKANKKNHDYCLQTEKSLLFILLRSWVKTFQSRNWVQVTSLTWTRVLCSVSTYWRVCTNLGVLPSILYIFIILIVQNCIIFCNHHVQSVFVFHFNIFNIKRGSIYPQACWNSSYFLISFIGTGNLLLRVK